MANIPNSLLEGKTILITGATGFIGRYIVYSIIYLNEKVFKYALPSKIIFMKDFPKTNVGKIDHKAFKEEM